MDNTNNEDGILKDSHTKGEPTSQGGWKESFANHLKSNAHAAINNLHAHLISSKKKSTKKDSFDEPADGCDAEPQGFKKVSKK